MAGCGKIGSPTKLRPRPLLVGCCAVPSSLCCGKILVAAEKMCDRVTGCAVGRVMLFLMVKPPPAISLRIRAAEVTAPAREILRQLDEADLVRRRVRHFAAKANVSVTELESVVRSLPSSRDRDSLQADVNLVRSTLKKISERSARL